MSNDLHIGLFRIIKKPGIMQGEMLVNGIMLGHTSEHPYWPPQGRDSDGPIFRPLKPGQYRVVISMSEWFGRYLPEIMADDYRDVRIHGSELVTLRDGDILLGKTLTPDGVRDTATVNKVLSNMIGETINTGGKCWIEIK
jgi:hypothetical protein